MQLTQPAHSAIDHLLSRAIAAAQAGDQPTAFGLLADVLRADTSCETAWLWLSGVTSDPAERRYCLDRVLAYNPAHAAARRGLSLLPAVAPRDPLREIAPLAQAAPASVGGLYASDPAHHAASPLAQAGPATGATIQLTPIVAPLAIAASPVVAAAPLMPTMAPLAFAAPSVVTAPPAASAPELPVAPYSQEQIDFALRQLGNGLDSDQTARSICERQSMTWGQAQELVRYVKTHNAVKLARSQAPMYIVIGVITLVGGVLLTFYYGAALIELARDPYSISPRTTIRWIALALTGMSMIIGGVIGLMTTLRSWWK